MAFLSVFFYVKWKCLWDITKDVLPAGISTRRQSILCSRLSSICVCSENLRQSLTCFSHTRGWWVWFLVVFCSFLE